MQHPVPTPATAVATPRCCRPTNAASPAYPLMLLALPISMRGRGLLIINTPAIPSIRGLLPLLLLPLGAWPPAASWRWVTLLARRTALGAARWQDRAAFNRCTAELSCTTAWKKV